MEERIIDLEMRLSEAQRVIDDLSDVVADQATRLERAEKRLALLLEAAAADGTEGSVVLGDQKPPHW